MWGTIWWLSKLLRCDVYHFHWEMKSHGQLWHQQAGRFNLPTGRGPREGLCRGGSKYLWTNNAVYLQSSFRLVIYCDFKYQNIYVINFLLKILLYIKSIWLQSVYLNFAYPSTCTSFTSSMQLALPITFITSTIHSATIGSLRLAVIPYASYLP